MSAPPSQRKSLLASCNILKIDAEMEGGINEIIQTIDGIRDIIGFFDDIAPLLVIEKADEQLIALLENNLGVFQNGFLIQSIHSFSESGMQEARNNVANDNKNYIYQIYGMNRNY